MAWEKHYVEVIANFNAQGKVVPQQIIWDDEHIYDIDKVLFMERMASRKAGGIGDCYSVRILGHERKIFREKDRWFVEVPSIN